MWSKCESPATLTLSGKKIEMTERVLVKFYVTLIIEVSNLCLSLMS